MIIKSSDAEMSEEEIRCKNGHDIGLVGRYNSGLCRACAKEYAKEYRKANRGKINAYARGYRKEYRKANRGKINAYMRSYKRKQNRGRKPFLCSHVNCENRVKYENTICGVHEIKSKSWIKGYADRFYAKPINGYRDDCMLFFSNEWQEEISDILRIVEGETDIHNGSHLIAIEGEHPRTVIRRCHDYIAYSARGTPAELMEKCDSEDRRVS